MNKNLRNSGIDIIGDVPWGTHFCQFYQTKEDLMDILVPYFKAGLENNEFCMWVTSKPLEVEEAKEALRKAVPDFDIYLEKGQIEIIPYTHWYVKNGIFDSDRVLNGWVEKLNQALANGYDGLRLTGNTFWLEKEDWNDFVDYEEEVDRVLGNYQMIALCTYCLDKCSATEIIDVVTNHQFALIKREGEWEQIESSKRRQAEEALREATERERFLNDVVEKAYVPFGVGAPDGRLLMFNQAFADLTGYSREELIQKQLTWTTDLTPPEWREAEAAHLAEALRTRQPVRYEKEHLRKDGTRVPIELFVQPVFDVSGNLLHYRSFLTDITVRKRAEKALRESELRFRLALRNAPVSVSAQDHNLRFIWAYNQRTAQPEEIIGKLDADIFTPEEAAHLAVIKRRVLEENVEVREKMWLDRPSGRMFLDVCFEPIRDEAGKSVGVGTATVDLTQMKIAEEALLESEERYATIFNRSPFAIALTKMPEGTTVDINDSFLRLFEYTREEVIGKTSIDLGITYAASRAQVAAELEARGSVHNFECTRTTRSGVQLTLSLNLDWVNIGGQRHILTTIQDITERKQAEEALRLSEQKFAIAFANNPAAIALTRLEDGLFLDVNDTWAVLTGYSRDETIGNFARTMHIWPTAEAATRFVQELQKKGSLRGWEQKFYDKSGKVFIAQLSAQTLTIRGEKVILSTLVDITERKQAEEVLQKQAALIDLSPDGIIIRQLDGTINFWNLGAQSLYGWTSQEVIGQQTHTLLRTWFPQPLEQMDEQVQKTGYWSGELIHCTKDGRQVVVQSRWQAKLDGQGNVEEILESNVDITERKRAEGKLLQAYESLQAQTEEIQVQNEEIQVQNEELQSQAEELQKANEALLESKKRFELLSEANALLLSSKDPEAMIQNIAEKVMSHLNCDVFFNYVFDEVWAGSVSMLSPE